MLVDFVQYLFPGNGERKNMELKEEKLGFRAIDKLFDYEKARRVHTRERNFYTGFLESVKKTSVHKPFPYSLHRRPLSSCQQECMKIVSEIIARTKKKDYVLGVISGAAGTGKTALWMSACALMNENEVNFEVVSPVASNCQAVGAKTIHSYCGWFDCKKSYPELVHETIHPRIREKVSKTQILCIDEGWLAGCKLISALLRRIWKIKSRNPPEALTIDSLPLSIIISGDSKQLVCPLDTPLDSIERESHCKFTREALCLMKNAHYRYELKSNLRQSSDKRFQVLLSNIREDRVDQDIDLLESRLYERLGSDDIERFKHVTHIFSTNENANRWNEYYISQLSIPVKLCRPVMIPNCEECKINYCFSYLGTGIKASVTRNILPIKNVVNGTEVVKENLFYKKNSDELPLFFTVYCEPKFTGATLEDKTIPICTITETGFCHHSKTKYRVTYLPLKNTYGCTVYRAQSRTLSSIVLHFAGFRFKDRAIYTGLSRCICLNNVVLTSEVPLKNYFLH